jgi:hypothetical protein
LYRLFTLRWQGSKRFKLFPIRSLIHFRGKLHERRRHQFGGEGNPRDREMPDDMLLQGPIRLSGFESWSESENQDCCGSPLNASSPQRPFPVNNQAGIKIVMAKRVLHDSPVIVHQHTGEPFKTITKRSLPVYATTVLTIAWPDYIVCANQPA